jgi:hypothetical protein
MEFLTTLFGNTPEIHITNQGLSEHVCTTFVREEIMTVDISQKSHDLLEFKDSESALSFLLLIFTSNVFFLT